MANKKKDSKKQSEAKHSSELLYDKINIYLMIAGVVVIFIGFALMAGGKQSPDVFNFDEIYSFRRVTLAPIVVIIGFLIEIYAVLRKPKFLAQKEEG